MTRVKICGISDIESAVVASQAGADFLGAVFAPSRRQVSPEKAREIVEAVRQLKTYPPMVGIFVNTPASEVNQMAEYCRLEWVQLSGDETWADCQKIERPVIKVFRISRETTQTEISTEIEKGYGLIRPKQLLCLLDSSVEGTYGGTGITFNWQVVKAVSAKFSVMIAGGLTPENVGQLIREIRPWAVDVSSGVETNGQKDLLKIRAFIEAVHKLIPEHGGGGYRD